MLQCLRHEPKVRLKEMINRNVGRTVYGACSRDKDFAMRLPTRRNASVKRKLSLFQTRVRRGADAVL